MTHITNHELADALHEMAVDSPLAHRLVLELAASRLREAPSVSDSAGWIEWEGGECPVEPRQEVEYTLRNGKTCQKMGRKLSWGWFDSDYDIIAYRLV